VIAGSQSAASAEPVSILIVDNDIRSPDSMERMLHASGYSETRVACHAALANC
jgi:hypothetical protein